MSDHNIDEIGEYNIEMLSVVTNGPKKPYRVYTQPVKHLVLDQTKYPQGWYHGKHEAGKHRPRTCYAEATLSAPYGGTCTVGCKYCLSGESLVQTPEGEIRVDLLCVGDKVIGKNGDGSITITTIIGTHSSLSNMYYKITLINGSVLNTTGEHPVYVVGQGWTEVKELYGQTKDCRLEYLQIDPIGYIEKQLQIKEIELVNESLQVYDIQTTTENFYANGILVHNCYVNDGVRGYQASHVSTVDPSYPDKFADYLKRMKISGAVYITPFTEPFGDLEEKYHNTQRLAEAVVKEGLPLFYTTKRVPPSWAINSLVHNPYSYIHFSINTSNSNHYKAFSPGAARYEDLLNAVRTVSQVGIFVGIQCNPIHVGITSLDDVKRLVDECKSAGAKHFIFKFVEKIIPTKQEFLKRLYAIKAFGVPAVCEFENSFNQVMGGVYTTHIATRIRYLEALLEYTRASGATMATCHEYYTGVEPILVEAEEIEEAQELKLMQLGPWYTTSDQCHGRGVPIYYRPDGKGPFEPLPGCYRKGCLWCADYGTKACDNGKLLRAEALKYRDFRAIELKGNKKNWKLPDSCFSPEFLSSYRAMARWSNPKLATDADLWGWK